MLTHLKMVGGVEKLSQGVGGVEFVWPGVKICFDTMMMVKQLWEEGVDQYRTINDGTNIGQDYLHHATLYRI